MINKILIDNDYDGKSFHIVYSDTPEKKDDLVVGNYQIEVQKKKTKIAVKLLICLGRCRGHPFFG
jgi:hypothetical protein